MFEAMYAGAEAGGAKPPWDYGAPRPQLVEWAEAQDLAGGGRQALVIGCGFGADAEFLAALGFRTTGFDFAPTAIAGALRRYPTSEVHYLVADVLDLPGEWRGMFRSGGRESHRAVDAAGAALDGGAEHRRVGGTGRYVAGFGDHARGALRDEGATLAADTCRGRGFCGW